MPVFNPTTINKTGSSPLSGNVTITQGANMTITQTGNDISFASSGGGGGSANVGTATINFGAFPGASDASVAVTGQASIVAGSVVNAWMRPSASADHTADEHMVETIKLYAGNIVASTGFTIYGFNASEKNEPLTEYGQGRNHRSTGTAAANSGQGANTHVGSVGGIGTRIYGQWNVQWQWA